MPKTDTPEIAELVVLVDENGWTVRTVRHVLTELGFRVLEFSSNAAALPIVASRRVDLVITAHASGEIDGLALAAHARTHWGEDRPAFLAMTATPDELSSDDRAAYDEVLAKPVKVGELMDAVDAALDVRAPFRQKLRRQA